MLLAGILFSIIYNIITLIKLNELYDMIWLKSKKPDISLTLSISTLGIIYIITIFALLFHGPICIGIGVLISVFGFSYSIFKPKSKKEYKIRRWIDGLISIALLILAIFIII